MKKSDVELGATYTAKVSGKLVTVRLDRENPRGGWDATNLATKKQVRLKTAQRLRRAVSEPATGESRPQRSDKAAKAHLAATAKADQENARLRDERAKDKDGMTASERAMTTAKKPAKAKDTKPKRTSALDAAAKVLADSKQAMNCKELIDTMAAKGYWNSPGGKTPHATLYSAILREMQNKGNDARFTKAERGKFALAKGA